MKKRSDFPGLWILGIVAASLLILWPLFHGGYYVSDDGEWMVIRLSAFYQSLTSGQFPVRLLGRLNNSYGYPVANFLYPGFLYLGSVLHLLGLSFPDAVKGIMGVAVLGSALFIYFALRKRFGSLASYVGTVSFLYAPYLGYDLYHRGSVGEVLAMLPASMLMFGISTGAYWLIAPALAFLIVSHNTIALIFGLAFAALLLVQKRPQRFLWHILLGAGIAAFFWIPAILERTFVRFDTVTVSDPSQYFISIPHALMLGIPTILSLALLLRTRTKHTGYDVVLLGIIVLGYFMALPVSAFLWRVPILSKIVQFPYRFLILPVVLGPWVIARVSDTMKGWKRIWLILIFGSLWLIPLGLEEAAITFVDRPIGYYTTNEGTTTVADEYMPRWVSEKPKQRSLDTVDVVKGDANLSARRFPKETIDATINVKEDGIIQINKVYYPGWGVTIDGVRAPIDYQNAFGFMRISVPTGIHEVRAAFRETPERFMADMVSLLSMLCYFIFVRRLQKNT